jgi:hypothetical protein
MHAMNTRATYKGERRGGGGGERERGTETCGTLVMHWLPAGEMVWSNDEGIVISTTGRVAGIPMEASLYANSISSMRFSKCTVPKCCGPAVPSALDG